jgi:hypothetical protein
MDRLTWGAFKRLVDETAGVTDETPVGIIDTSGHWTLEPEDVNAHINEQGELTVY